MKTEQLLIELSRIVAQYADSEVFMSVNNELVIHKDNKIIIKINLDSGKIEYFYSPETE